MARQIIARLEHRATQDAKEKAVAEEVGDLIDLLRLACKIVFET